MDLRGWLARHWRPLLQYTGYLLLAVVGALVQPLLGLALLGLACILIANGW